MGVQQTVGGVSRVLFPWWNGWAFDHIGMSAPFVVSGVLTLGSVGLIRGMIVGHEGRGGEPAPAPVPSPDVVAPPNDAKTAV
jgi:hypothetical protein